MGAFDVTLTEDDMAYLDEKYLPHKIELCTKFGFVLKLVNFNSLNFILELKKIINCK